MSQDITEQTPPYDFGADPVSMNTHRPNDPRPNKLTHRMRKPTIEQWLLWGHEIYEERRNLSEEEIREDNESRGEDDRIESTYQTSFNEFDASRRLYEAIAIDVTEYHPDENGELQPTRTHPLTPELLERAILGTDVAIGGLYKSYCNLEESSQNGTGEVRVRQTIGSSDTPPSVLHVLREATEEERQKFKDETPRAYQVAGRPDTIRICNNLRVADDLYNSMLLHVENATVNGQGFNESTRAVFLKAINPVFKLKVLEEAVQIEMTTFYYDNR
jgi:hypothetical protein